jgi:hypothetical protein
VRPAAAILGAPAIVLIAAFAAAADPMPAPPLLPTPQPSVRFTGGDGSTCSQAVVIEGASHEKDGVRAQRWWVYTKHAGSSITSQEVSEKNGKAFETIAIVTAAGGHQAVCFDITSFYGKP